jgi:hypothetical protein
LKRTIPESSHTASLLHPLIFKDLEDELSARMKSTALQILWKPRDLGPCEKMGVLKLPSSG